MITSAYTHDTMPTQYVEADGVRWAYRRFGAAGMQPPVLFIQHFRGSMDNHDPAITDALAEDREVILFDNRGVAGTSGVARETIEDMASDTATFVDALGVRAIDVLAHSMGGDVGQTLALQRPDTNGFVELKGIRCPTLVVNGSNDIVVATVNSFILQQHIPDAKLVLYPDSNHGAHYQFHVDFVREVRAFLDAPTAFDIMSSLITVITGTSSGFGFETARLLAAAGHRVYGTMRDSGGRNAEPAKRLAALAVQIVELDVTDDGSVERGAAKILDESGHVDVLVNNAGSAYFGTTEAFTPKSFERQLATNVIGPFRVSRAFLPGMRANKSGLLIFISSIAGRFAIPFTGIYTASKWAIEGLAESLLK